MKRGTLSRLANNYGMAAVLVALCIYYSWATLRRQNLGGAPAAAACKAKILHDIGTPKNVLIVVSAAAQDGVFSNELTRLLHEAGVSNVSTASGEPRVVRIALQSMIDSGHPPDAIAATEECASWLPNVLQRMPMLASVRVVTPGTTFWPTFLQADNLLNVANQIVVIAIIAVGSTMVIITGGIDLSVGSLVALSAVLVGLLIRDHAGGTSATTFGLVWCSAVAIIASGIVGAFSGAIVAFFRVPAFIATLSMMQVASGLAYIFASGQSIYDIPHSFVWLGRGLSFGIPNAVILMIAVYVIAYIVMARMRLGRYIYAVGGNAEASRLSGVRVGQVLMIVYIISGLSAGVGGVVLASQLKSSSPTYGLAYELYVIAAVVVGGTSLSGGSGKVLGTLIGALIIGVIQNGMNLTGVESYRQKVVLGLVILGAVLLDTLKKQTWRFPRRNRSKRSAASEPAPVASK